MIETTLDTCSFSLLDDVCQYLQRIYGPTNVLTQIVAEKQLHPTTAASKTAPPTTAARRFTSHQAKEARLYTAATQLKLPAKRATSRCLVRSRIEGLI